VDTQAIKNYSGQSLDRLLEMHSTLYMKNYGAGNMSTFSIRGSSAAQTGIYWYGMNLNNVLSGVADLSLIPVSFFQQVNIHYSGSEGIGQYLELRSGTGKEPDTKTIQSAWHYESLQNNTFTFQASKAGFRLNSAISHQQNRFSYYSPNQKKTIISQSPSRGIQLMGDAIHPWSKKVQSGFHGWFFTKYRSMAPADFESDIQRQENQWTFRGILETTCLWNQNLKSVFSQGISREFYSFSDSFHQVSSHYHSYRIPLLMQHRFQFSPVQSLELKTEWSYSRNMASDTAFLNNTLLRLGYQHARLPLKMKFDLMVQKEFNNRFATPWAWLCTGSIPIWKHQMQLKILASCLNRNPVLNELFYFPGGNSLLRPERSRNIEAGMEWQLNRGHSSFYGSAGLYGRKVSDWIVWYGSSVFTPHNILGVYSRGLDMDVHFTQKLYPVKNDTMDVLISTHSSVWSHPLLQLSVQYAYNLATTTASAIPLDYSIGKQIPYTPRYIVRAGAGCSTQRLALNLNYHYTGYRFITSDESQYLKPYHLFSVDASFRFQIKRHSLRWQVQVRNFTNRQIETLPGRFMPGRTGCISLHYSL
ncbi:MAG TPA: TonB-dependent receptor, partial [Chitinophagaceae bacterium]|nr:TonB-dependent receptor [Chitinophagaceae bacterium]